MSEVEVRTGSVRTSPTQMKTRGGRPPRLVPVTEQMPEVDPRYSSVIQTLTVLPATINLVIYQGDDFFFDMQVVDQNSNLIDLTNSQPMSQIRLTPDGPTVLASFVVTIDTGVLGLLHFHLPALQSNLLPLTSAWDVQLSNPNITTLAAGSVTCEPQVTQ